MEEGAINNPPFSSDYDKIRTNAILNYRSKVLLVSPEKEHQ